MTIVPVIHYNDRLVHDCILLWFNSVNFIDKFVVNKDELEKEDYLSISNDFERVWKEMKDSGFKWERVV